MQTILMILLAITLVGVAASLFAGIFGMARGDEFNRKHGNRLMRARVMLQGLALALFVLLLLTGGE